jgi:SAM-dependent methyltransferase
VKATIREGESILSQSEHDIKKPSPQDPFEGRAEYYVYRYDYPAEIAQVIATTFDLDGRGRLLDVGCGTGKLAFLLRPLFEEVVGIDRSADMLLEAERQAIRQGIAGMKWVLGDAEEVGNDLGRFRLVSCGDAFHWMDRGRALKAWHAQLEEEGGLALVSAGGGSGSGPEPWQIAMWEVIHRHLGPRRRNAEWQERMAKRHEEVVQESGLFRLVSLDYVEHFGVRDFESVLGFLYSTSFCGKALLGDNAPRFEEDLRESLLRAEPSGRFTEKLQAEYILAQRV